MKKKQLAVDANPNPAGDPTPKTKAKVTTPNIPTKDADIDTLASNVSKKWADNPTFTLAWIDQSAFAEMSDSFSTNLNNRLTVGGSRPSKTQTLKQVNTSINGAVKEVKVYIEKKFKKANAAAQFGRYGIVKENGNYRLPKDNDKRKITLLLMAVAIEKDGFAAEEFGTTFWTDIISSFNTALDATSNTAQDISNKVSAKDTDKAKIHKVLIAITHLIYANYPDTSDAVLREWGFIKQNY